MLKRDLDLCYEKGNLTKEDYEEWLSRMKENENGELIGQYPNGKAFYKYNMDGDIFDRPLYMFLYDRCYPPLGIEDTTDPPFDVFEKYGYTNGGIHEGFEWNLEALRKAPEIDLWKMIAIIERYWRINYSRLYFNRK